MLRCIVHAACVGLLGFAGCCVNLFPWLDPNNWHSDGNGARLTGRIQAPRQATRPMAGDPARTIDEGYMIVAQSNQTGEIYRAVTDPNGDFELTIPDSETGNTFVVTILGPDGRAVGPVMYGQANGNGITGLQMEGAASMGTISLPADPNNAAIQPGADATLDDWIDTGITTRVDENGVPAGLSSNGKGLSAMGSSDTGQNVDEDGDGLIDIFDADDNGDGIVDDLDPAASIIALPAGLHLNFFMNLKIQSHEAPTYYGSDAGAIATALGVNTVITFEVFADAGVFPKTISSVRILETPGPTYLPTSEALTGAGGSLSWVSWSAAGYAVPPDGTERFQTWVRPNAPMNAGDTFTVELAFSDGTTAQYSRMLNFVFKNIPKLLKYGAAGSLSTFNVEDPNIDGTYEKPIPFDGSQDLTLVFNPPPDETGALITGTDYSFGIFYLDSSGQQVQDIDVGATWPVRPAGFGEHNGTAYEVPAADMTLLPDNTYSVTLPKEIFANTVVRNSGATANIASYKMDLSAVVPTGNCAIMLTFKKQ